MRSSAARLNVVPERPPIIAPYERVSAVMGRDDEAFRSPDIQRRSNLDRIAEAGGVVYPEALEHPERFRDIDRTGRDFNRQGIQYLLQLKREGKIDGIAVLDISRVGRTTAMTLDAINAFREGPNGVFLSTRERIGIDDTPMGEWMLTIVASMAQLHSDNIALGWRSVIETRAANGLHNGNPPLGYRFVRDVQSDGTLVVRAPRVIEPDSAIAPKIVELFERYENGETATSLWRWLMHEGIFRGGTVKRMLANPFYAGGVRLFAYYGKAKSRKRVPDVEPFINWDGKHPAIISRELFERVQLRLRREAAAPRRFVSASHSLVGLAVCAHCGRALVRQGAKLPYLRDQNGVQRGCVGVGTPSIEQLDALTRAEVAAMLLTLDVDASGRADAVRRRAAAVAERDKLAADIARFEKALGETDADLYVGKLTESRHANVTGILVPQLDRARAQLAELPTMDDDESRARVVEAARELSEHWDERTPAQRNTLLRVCGLVRVAIRKNEFRREPVSARAHFHWSFQYGEPSSQS